MSLIAKIKWRCRRGTKELDYMLLGYFTRYFEQAGSEEKLLFEQLLSLQDSQLILFLLGAQEPESKGLAEIVKKIRHNSDL